MLNNLEIIHHKNFSHNGYLLIVKFKGKIPQGLKGKDSINHYRNLLEENYQKIAPPLSVLFDLSHLSEPINEAIASLWIASELVYDARAAVICSEQSRTAIKALIRKSIPIPLFSSLDQALNDLEKPPV